MVLPRPLKMARVAVAQRAREEEAGRLEKQREGPKKAHKPH